MTLNLYNIKVFDDNTVKLSIQVQDSELLPNDLVISGKFIGTKEQAIACVKDECSRVYVYDKNNNRVRLG